MPAWDIAAERRTVGFHSGTAGYQHLHDVLRFLGLEAWLAKHDPDLHGRLYEVDDLAVFDPGADDPAEG